MRARRQYRSRDEFAASRCETATNPRYRRMLSTHDRKLLGLVPKHQWRPVTDLAATGTPNIQRGAVGRKP